MASESPASPALELVTLPCLQDNYSFLVHCPESGATAVVDVPEAGPISDALNSRGWTLSEVWLTHHHGDHVGGLEDLLKDHPAKVTGAAADAHRLPPLDRAVGEGDHFAFGGENVEILDVSGHTLGHIAYILPDGGFAFTGDSLMAMGCGRLFEGTAAQMHASLGKLAALPGETLVCSGHEYTTANARFAVTIEPDNPDLAARVDATAAARAAGVATVPSTLDLELRTNPFLRGHIGSVKAHLGMQEAPSEAVFAEIRARKDRF